MSRVIQNFESLASTAMRLDALSIAEAGYAAVNAGIALTQKLSIEDNELYIDDARYPLTGRRVFFVGVGKCAIAAAITLEKILGDHLTEGIALDVSPLDQQLLRKITPFIGTHPLPSEMNERATEHIIEMLSHLEASDLVIMLISGGGSTLLCLHEEPMTCLDESALFTELTAHGATIQDINTVRKHTSLARGGRLAKIAFPAEVVSLIVSDVPGNDIGCIASGPTVLDTSTVADARAILVRYNITPPAKVAFIETPKEKKYFERVTNFLFLSSHDALIAMQSEATSRGYRATIVDERFSGEARETGRYIVDQLHAAAPKTALLYAGESTVTLPSYSAVGGRNQEMALAVLADIREDELLIPFSSDGHDNTDHAGAIADTTTRLHALEHKLSIDEHLSSHRSYNFFTTTGDALITGYTGSNVSDLIIAIKN